MRYIRVALHTYLLFSHHFVSLSHWTLLPKHMCPSQNDLRVSGILVNASVFPCASSSANPLSNMRRNYPISICALISCGNLIRCCVATGASPSLAAAHPRVIGIRDTEASILAMCLPPPRKRVRACPLNDIIARRGNFWEWGVQAVLNVSETQDS